MSGVEILALAAGVALLVLAGRIRRRARTSVGRGAATAPRAASGSPRMETLSEAIGRLERAGFRDSFQARDDGLFALEAQRLLAPEALVIEELVRFEGVSDPQDESVLFALRSQDDAVRGTFVATYGTQTDPASAEIMKRLEASGARG